MKTQDSQIKTQWKNKNLHLHIYLHRRWARHFITGQKEEKWIRKASCVYDKLYGPVVVGRDLIFSPCALSALDRAGRGVLSKGFSGLEPVCCTEKWAARIRSRLVDTCQRCRETVIGKQGRETWDWPKTHGISDMMMKEIIMSSGLQMEASDCTHLRYNHDKSYVLIE